MVSTVFSIASGQCFIFMHTHTENGVSGNDCIRPLPTFIVVRLCIFINMAGAEAAVSYASK